MAACRRWTNVVAAAVCLAACGNDGGSGGPGPTPVVSATPTPTASAPPPTPTPTDHGTPTPSAGTPTASPTPSTTASPTPPATPPATGRPPVLQPGPDGISVVRTSGAFDLYEEPPPVPLVLSTFRGCQRAQIGRVAGLAFDHLSNGPVSVQVLVNGVPILSAPLTVENGRQFSVSASDDFLVELAPDQCFDFSIVLAEPAPI
jgi:hypothetical protein